MFCIVLQASAQSWDAVRYSGRLLGHIQRHCTCVRPVSVGAVVAVSIALLIEQHSMLGACMRTVYISRPMHCTLVAMVWWLMLGPMPHMCRMGVATACAVLALPVRGLCQWTTFTVTCSITSADTSKL